MIIISNDTVYLKKEFTQETYDQALIRVDMKGLECDCGSNGKLVKIGYYQRYYKTSTRKICIQIQRVMCKHCGRTHALFVECMVPSSMLLVTTQIELLRSYYNHRLEEFLLVYPTIERSNAFYVVKNFEKKWSKILKLTGLSLMDEEKKIIKVFIKKYQMQFMQMRSYSKIVSQLRLSEKLS